MALKRQVDQVKRERLKRSARLGSPGDRPVSEGEICRARKATDLERCGFYTVNDTPYCGIHQGWDERGSFWTILDARTTT